MESMANARISNITKKDLINFVRLRIAGERDDQAIGDFLKEDLRNVASRRRDGINLVIEIGSRLVGTISIVRSNAPSPYLNLSYLVVDSDFYPEQLAGILVDEAEKLSVAWGSKESIGERFVLSA